MIVALLSQGPVEAVHKAALALGTANQLTNILRDVGEDAVERNRIYVPLEELDQFGISESEVRALPGFQRVQLRTIPFLATWHLFGSSWRALLSTVSLQQWRDL